MIQRELILDNLQMVRDCPVMFQEAIIKEADIRATVVGDEVFAAEIRTGEGAEYDNLDWRNYAATRSYHPHILPKEVAKKCVEVTKRLNLSFGCIDLGYSRPKDYTFFEINPQGQWLPSELELGYNISDSLIHHLTR